MDVLLQKEIGCGISYLFRRQPVQPRKVTVRFEAVRPEIPHTSANLRGAQHALEPCARRTQSLLTRAQGIPGLPLFGNIPPNGMKPRGRPKGPKGQSRVDLPDHEAATSRRDLHLVAGGAAVAKLLRTHRSR